MSVPPLIPWPRSVELSPESCDLTPGVQIQAPMMLRSLAEQAQRALQAEPNPSGAVLDFKIDSSLEGGPEAYRLSVTPNAITLTGASSAGVFYALQTLLQLTPEVGPIPCLEIRDSPRFSWRGALVDVGRHFMPTSALRRFIDAMARYKLNVLHLHLTEDQGWRIEIKMYPRLTAIGSIR